MFLRNYWYVAAMPQELENGALLGRWILDEPVLIYRTADGEVTAMRDICPHRSARLSAGERDGDTVRCLYHGLEFGPDGTCLRVPAQDGTPPNGLRVQSYPVAEKWRLIWIWMGAPERADENLIPDFHWNDDPDWFPVGDYMHLDCHYQLLADNLMDLSHEAYVHRYYRNRCCFRNTCNGAAGWRTRDGGTDYARVSGTAFLSKAQRVRRYDRPDAPHPFRSSRDHNDRK